LCSMVFMSVFVPIPCCFYCYGSVVWFEVGHYNTYTIALFAQCCLGYSRSLCSRWTSGLNFQSLWWVSLDFDGDWIEHVDRFC
jgi:hypothetical protein